MKIQIQCMLQSLNTIMVINIYHCFANIIEKMKFEPTVDSKIFVLDLVWTPEA